MLQNNDVVSCVTSTNRLMNNYSYLVLPPAAVIIFILFFLIFPILCCGAPAANAAVSAARTFLRKA